MAMRTYWFWKSKQLDEHWFETHSFDTAEYPHPFTVVSDDKPTGAEPVWSGELDDDGNLFIRLGVHSEAITAPPMWFVVQDAPSPFPGGPPVPHTIIHAMVGPDFAPLTIVRGKRIAEIGMPITAIGAGQSERVGFVSFNKETSVIQQVMVKEAWRRKRITVALFSVADLVTVAGGYAKYLNGGEVTTPDGEKLRQAWATSTRVNKRTGSVNSQ